MTTVSITLTKTQAETMLAVALERVIRDAWTPTHKTLAARLERTAALLAAARAHVARDPGEWDRGSGVDRLAREYVRMEQELRPFLKA